MIQEQTIDIDRLMGRIEALSQISAPGPGVTRLSLTPEWQRANEVVGQWMREAGMEVRRDAVGNLIGRHDGATPEAPALMIGSHLDTVIDGGKFDGALGVLAGLEVVQSLADQGVRPSHPIEVVSFTDEEGVRFRTAFAGSRGMAGTLTERDLDAIDESGVSLAEAMRDCGFDPQAFRSARREPSSLLGYLELHIEQGPVLEQQDLPCGVVSGIVGVTRYSWRVEGKAGHAGTTPMVHRHDALAGAAQMVLAVEQVARQQTGCVATVGTLTVEPGAANVVPGAVEGMLDIRHIDEDERRVAFERIREEWERTCQIRGLTLAVDRVTDAASAPCAPRLISAIADALAEPGQEPLELISGAGHDAMEMASITNIGMLFVRCASGLSHNPAEEASAADIARGTAALRAAVLALTS